MGALQDAMRAKFANKSQFKFEKLSHEKTKSIIEEEEELAQKLDIDILPSLFGQKSLNDNSDTEECNSEPENPDEEFKQGL